MTVSAIILFSLVFSSGFKHACLSYVICRSGFITYFTLDSTTGLSDRSCRQAKNRNVLEKAELGVLGPYCNKFRTWRCLILCRSTRRSWGILLNEIARKLLFRASVSFYALLKLFPLTEASDPSLLSLFWAVTGCTENFIFYKYMYLNSFKLFAVEYRRCWKKRISC